MRVLVLYCHPDPGSYVAALHRAVVEALAAAGHAIDDCDLYAEGFDPSCPWRSDAATTTLPPTRGPSSPMSTA